MWFYFLQKVARQYLYKCFIQAPFKSWEDGFSTGSKIRTELHAKANTALLLLLQHDGRLGPGTTRVCDERHINEPSILVFFFKKKSHSRFQSVFISSYLFRCVEDRTAPTQQQLIHIKAVMLKESEMGRQESRSKETCLNGHEVDELSLDANVLIRYHRGLVLTGQPVLVSVNLRGNLSAKLVIIR